VKDPEKTVLCLEKKINNVSERAWRGTVYRVKMFWLEDNLIEECDFDDFTVRYLFWFSEET
jgi:Fe2+ or Zn2+ uptake regulation protein